MKDAEIRAVIEEELGNIAPEVDLGVIDPEADLREEIDIDSMDFLNLVSALHKRLKVDIPETDYDRLRTLNAAVEYLTDGTAR
jgi:acyl carrier protein